MDREKRIEKREQKRIFKHFLKSKMPDFLSLGFSRKEVAFKTEEEGENIVVFFSHSIIKVITDVPKEHLDQERRDGIIRIEGDKLIFKTIDFNCSVKTLYSLILHAQQQAVVRRIDLLYSKKEKAMRINGAKERLQMFVAGILATEEFKSILNHEQPTKVFYSKGFYFITYKSRKNKGKGWPAIWFEARGESVGETKADFKEKINWAKSLCK